MADAGRGVGLVLVERLVLEQRLRQRIELRSVLAQQRDDFFVGLFHDAPDFGVDELLRVLRDLGGTGQDGPRPSVGMTVSGPTALLMPQRPTIWRAISVSCWMSDSAPVVTSA